MKRKQLTIYRIEVPLEIKLRGKLISKINKNVD